MPELKPCPFCGGTRIESRMVYNDRPFWTVECLDCEACCGWQSMEESEAVTAWNKRADTTDESNPCDATPLPTAATR